MGLRIDKPTAKQKTDQDLMWEMVASSAMLNSLFNRKHPFIKYKLLDFSDSLNYKVSIGERSVFGSCFIHDFLGKLTEPDIDSRAKISFHNVIRNLLFNAGNRGFDMREYSVFIGKMIVPGKDPNTDTLDINTTGITEYLKLALEDLGFDVEYEFNQHHFWHLSKDGIEPLAMFIPANYVEKLQSGQMPQQLYNSSTKGYVQNLVVRLLLSARDEETAKAYAERVQKFGKETADQVEAVREQVQNAPRPQLDKLSIA